MSETRGALVMPWWSYLLIPAAVLLSTVLFSAVLP